MRKEVIGNCVLYLGDCLEALPMLSDVHSCVTDPPYHLTSTVKRIGGKNAAGSASKNVTHVHKPATTGFMGQTWDGGDIAFRVETWNSVYRALLPGAHLAAFSGTRTYHRMAVAIEDAGFEVRDMLSWLYGSGFPKSHNVSKAIDKAAGAEREKIRVPAKQVRNPTATGGGRDSLPEAKRPWMETALERGFHEKAGDKPATEAARQWEGWGTALKPACEPICLGRKPLIGSVVQTVLKFGTGAINVDATKVGDDVLPAQKQGPHGACYRPPSPNIKITPERNGRWPANVLHDSSLEVLEAFPPEFRPAIRYFYSPKASREEREEGLEAAPKRQWVEGSSENKPQNRSARKRSNHHPTVKPIDLMAWLCRLITPPGGTVLDPFMGSGSTGIAAARQGFAFVGIEQSPEYFDIACRRIEAALEKPDLFIPSPSKQPAVTVDLFDGLHT